MSSHDNTSNKNARMVTGLFRDRGSVERADNCLSARGYSKDDVTLMMSDATRMTHFGDTDSELGSKAAEGAGIPEERVVHDEEGIKNCGILMGVSPRSDDDAAHIGRSARRGGRRGRHGWAWRGGDGR